MDDKYVQQTLQAIDVLVDGLFILKLKDYTLKRRGSSNQRIINLQTEEEIPYGN